MTASEFAERVQARRNGAGWMAKCPAHEDVNPSLSIAQGDDGRVLLHCHAGCSTDHVLAELGLTRRDLFTAPSAAHCMHTVPATGHVVARYHYTDAQGRRLFDVVRKRGKRFHQEPANGKRGRGAMEGVELVLYHLPDVIAAVQAGEVVWIAEGEKDVEALKLRGVTATCNPGGAGKWRSSYTDALRGAHGVVIVADADEPGRRHARDIADQTTAAGISSFVVEAIVGRDASDHLAAHGLDEFRQTVVSEPEPTSVVSVVSVVPAGDDWPEPLGAAAFHGLAGEIVAAMEPHTEADPAAILLQLLIGFGSMAGRSAYFVAGADRHYPNLFGTLVGVSSKGRKGSAWSMCQALLGAADAEWADQRVQSGLSSGEGLIHAVRDAVMRRDPVKQNGRVVDFTEYEADPGVKDKRLLAIEPEFASVLRVATRDGNTVSTQIRQAFDTGKLGTLTKNSPTKATGAHVSIIAHVTGDELRRELTRTDAANGFANRFLWVCVKRSKELPDGGEFHRVDVAPLVRRLAEAAHAACGVERVERDLEARELWHRVYHDLSEPGLGLAGAVTSRAEALTMRLALVYALLDSSKQVRRVHLEAALEVWRYCQDSARVVWGSSTGDPIADELHQAMLRTGEMTRTEMRDMFGRNLKAERVNAALMLLEGAGLAQRVESKATVGRPAEIWQGLRHKRPIRPKSAGVGS